MALLPGWLVGSGLTLAGRPSAHPSLHTSSLASPRAPCTVASKHLGLLLLPCQLVQPAHQHLLPTPILSSCRRSPSPLPHPGYRHHSPAPAPPAAGTQQPAKAQQPKQQQQSGSSSGASAGTPAPPAVAAVDLTASTVLVTAGGQPPAALPHAKAKAGTAPSSARKSCDSNSSGQSWELVGGGEAGTALPASA